MLISLIEYILTKRVVTIYTVDNQYWQGVIVFAWIDHLVLATDGCDWLMPASVVAPKVFIPFSRIDSIREYDYHAAKNNIQNAYNKK